MLFEKILGLMDSPYQGEMKLNYVSMQMILQDF